MHILLPLLALLTACGDTRVAGPNEPWTGDLGAGGGFGATGDGDGDGDWSAGDGDGDTCPDEDADGLCDDIDPCPLDPENDADMDGACESQDPCPLDWPDDPDGDGVCTSDDPCPDGDADGDGACDDADPCPNDPADDSDGDGMCDGDDACPDDPDNDADRDGKCADVDPCPVDFPDDSDLDGVCDSDDDDACPLGDMDADADGWADACDTVLWTHEVSEAGVGSPAFGSIHVELIVEHAAGRRYHLEAIATGELQTVPDDIGASTGIYSLNGAGVSSQTLVSINGDGWSAIDGWTSVPRLGAPTVSRIACKVTVSGGVATVVWQLRGVQL